MNIPFKLNNEEQFISKINNIQKIILESDYFMLNDQYVNKNEIETV